jgi:multicomponent Na+:H+ antiporter subunit F
MNVFYTAVVVVLLLCLIVGLIRVLAGPDNANRMLAAQLFGTIGTTVVIVLSVLQNNEVITNVALVMTLLASITVIAFLKLAEQPIDSKSSENKSSIGENNHDS